MVTEQSRSMWYVYILECSNGKYYTGCTNNLDRRLKEHYSGNGDHYTQTNQPVQLLYTEEYPTRKQAFKREKQLKGCTRRKKEALISGDLERLKTL